MKRLIEPAGWVGTVLILLSYGLVSYEVIAPGLPYQIINLLGALGLSVCSWQKRNYQTLVVQFVWGIIALIAIVKLSLG